jgi:two-component system, response regulator PdtaR
MHVVLTVADEFLLSEYLGGILKDAGYSVVSVQDADEAIAMLESRNDIRLIITDINMQGQWMVSD